jgi:membrane-associated protease RseP (regulator of RpoE activity)
MIRKTLLLLSACLLWSAGVAFGQVAPPAPPTPAAPPAAQAPGALAFRLDGNGNYLGITPAEVTKENMARYGLLEPRGVAVISVIADSPAERAGLKKDDVIIRFDGEPVTNLRKLNRLIGEAEPDHTAKLTVSRGGSEQEIPVKLGKHNNRLLGATPSLRSFQWQWPNDLTKQFGNQGNLVFALGASRRIGVTTTQLTRQLGEYFGVGDGHGLLVTSVNENGPASKAGLKAGDVITEVDGAKVERATDLSRAINRKKDGEVTLTIIRHKSARTIKLTPEGGQAFDVSPDFPVMPQISEITVPRLELQQMPAIELPQMPNIVLPHIPNIELQVMPNLKGLTVPSIEIELPEEPM